MGKEEGVKGLIDILYYKVANWTKIIYDIIPIEKNKNRKKQLKKNSVLKNKYKEERCFIVANGPSIQKENLDLLEGENVFTVNQMIRKPEFAKLNPIINFWADPAYFDENMPNESKEEFSKLFKLTCECSQDIINFVPMYAYDFLKKRDLIEERVHFFDASLQFYDGYNKKIDFTKRTPDFRNIVQYAISMAIYMGFKEIYLLGCDSTGIITKINSVLNQSIEECYTYDLGTKGQNYVNTLVDYFTVEEQFVGWAQIFHLYGEIYKYCQKNDISLINCSKTTIIQSIPRRNLEEVMSNEDDK